MTEHGPAQAKMPTPLEWHMVDRFFSGEATPEEASAVRLWAAADASHAAELDAMRRVWAAAAAPRPTRFDVDAGWRALRPRMNEVESLERAHAERAPSPSSAAAGAASRAPRLRLLGAERRRPPWRRAGWLAAAAVLICAATLARGVAGRSDPAVGEDVREYATGVGQRAEVMLADGTRAWLGVGSRLRVSSAYGERHRELYLEGEGYFDVVPDARRPFIVHANGVVAEALGTEFVVRRHVDDIAAVVVVVSGRVAVRTDSGGSPRRGVALAAGQMAAVDGAGLITLTSDADVERYTGWREGRLEFHGAPLSHVSRELARWYGLDLVIEDSSLLAVPVTGTFTDMPAATVVPIVCQSLNARCESTGRQVRIRE